MTVFEKLAALPYDFLPNFGTELKKVLWQNLGIVLTSAPTNVWQHLFHELLDLILTCLSVHTDGVITLEIHDLCRLEELAVLLCYGDVAFLLNELVIEDASFLEVGGWLLCQIEALRFLVVVISYFGAEFGYEPLQFVMVLLDRFAVIDATVLCDQRRKVNQIDHALRKVLLLEHEFDYLVLVVLLLLKLLDGLFLMLDENLEVKTDLAQDDRNLVLITDLVIAVHELLEVSGFLPVDVEALE